MLLGSFIQCSVNVPYFFSYTFLSLSQFLIKIITSYIVYINFLFLRANIIQHDTFKSGKVNMESVAKPAVLRPGAEGNINELIFWFVQCFIYNLAII